MALIAIAIGVNKADVLRIYMHFNPQGPRNFAEFKVEKIKDPGPSPWFEREKERFTSALSTSRYDLLVLPVSANPDSLDSVSRNMMMRYLANALRTRSEFKVPDSTWTLRALGENQRKFDDDEVSSLLKRIDAEWLIESEVSRPNHGMQYNLTITVKQRQSGMFSNSWRIHARHVWENIEFSDLVPPEVVFRSRLEEIIAALKLPISNPPPQIKYKCTLAYSDKPLETLIRSGGNTPVDRALALQLVASLYPAAAFEKQQLWERSVIALEGADPESDKYRLLMARAATNLHRRPYALNLLSKPRTDPEKALYWYLQGNLPKVEENIGKTTDAIDTVLGLIDVDTIRSEYLRDEGYTSRREKAAKLVPKWKELVASRLSTADWFDAGVQNYTLRVLAKQYQIDSGELPEMEQIKNYVLQRFGIPAYPQSKEWIEYIQPLEDRVWEDQSAGWSKLTGDQRLREWDYYDLLFADSRYASIKGFYSTYGRQVLMDRAERVSASLKKVLNGYPPFIVQQADMAKGQSDYRNTSSDKRKKYTKEAVKLALYVNRWSGGETIFDHRAQTILANTGRGTLYRKYSDEPLRYYRYLNWQRMGFKGQIRHVWDRSDQYSVFDTDTYYWKKWVMEKKHDPNLKQYVLKNRNRFVGSWYWTEKIINKYQNQPTRKMIQGLQQALRHDPDNWWFTEKLVNKYIDAGELKLANAAVVSSILYRNKEEQTVGKGVELVRIAQRIDAAGSRQWAIPLYKKAVSYDTGSELEFIAKERLAEMDNDYRLAATTTLQSIERYGSLSQKYHYIRLMFLLGKPAKAFEMLDQVVGKGEYNQKYIPEFTVRLGFRINKTSREQVMEWLLDHASGTNTYDQKLTLEWAYFLTFMADEIPSDQDIQNVERLNSRLSHLKEIIYVYNGYAYYRRGDCEKANTWLSKIPKLNALHENHYGNVWYYRLSCALKSGQNNIEAKYFDAGAPKTLDRSFHYFLGRALNSGYRGKHREALAALDKAGTLVDYPSDYGTNTALMLIDTAEQLYQKTGRLEYRKMILKEARSVQNKRVEGWPGLVEAQYDKDRQFDTEFLARAIYLNPNSRRIKMLDPVAVREARQWLQQNRPFN